MDLKAHVGRRLAELRETRGLSQFQLAKATGVSSQFIGRLETGERAPSFDVLAALATALEVEPVEFFSDSGAKAHEQPKQPIALSHLYGAARRLESEDLRLVLALVRRLGNKH